MSADVLPPWQNVASSGPKGEQDFRILVADDEPGMRKFIAQALSVDDYRMTCVQDGVKALKAIQEARRKSLPFDLLILDVGMPGMGGVALLGELKALNIEIPILIISGRLTRNDFLKLRVKGCEHFLIKSFGPEALKKRVKTILSEVVEV